MSKRLSLVAAGVAIVIAAAFPGPAAAQGSGTVTKLHGAYIFPLNCVPTGFDPGAEPGSDPIYLECEDLEYIEGTWTGVVHHHH